MCKRLNFVIVKSRFFVWLIFCVDFFDVRGILDNREVNKLLGIIIFFFFFHFMIVVKKQYIYRWGLQWSELKYSD